jgi:phosphoribosylformimino-5-aminoimidazole carboxamide ribotide isomerase
MDDATVFGDDPVAMAQRWVDAGAQRLHIVDLDGAFAGEPRNAEAIAGVCRAHPHLPVQVGGGIRDLDTIASYLQADVRYVIIGTQAVREPEFAAAACARYPGRVIVGIDARDGLVAVEGWAEASTRTAPELAAELQGVGVVAIVYTDISRDGMLQGVNAEATAALAGVVDIPVIASGGVSSLDDIRRLQAVAEQGIEGVIVGRALYEGTLDLGKAQQLAAGAAG